MAKDGLFHGTPDEKEESCYYSAIPCGRYALISMQYNGLNVDMQNRVTVLDLTYLFSPTGPCISVIRKGIAESVQIFLSMY